jgi:hypothetical protein
MESAVSGLWGFDDFAWRDWAAAMRLANGKARVNGRARPAGAAHIAVDRLKGRRFQRDE